MRRETSMPADIQGSIFCKLLLNFLDDSGKNTSIRLLKVLVKLVKANWGQFSEITWSQLYLWRAFLNLSTLAWEKFLDFTMGGLILLFLNEILWIRGRWSEIFQRRSKDSKTLLEEFVRMWSIRVAEFSVILVGFVTICKKPNEQSIQRLKELLEPLKCKILILDNPLRHARCCTFHKNAWKACLNFWQSKTLCLHRISDQRYLTTKNT